MSKILGSRPICWIMLEARRNTNGVVFRNWRVLVRFAELELSEVFTGTHLQNYSSYNNLKKRERIQYN